MIFSYSPPPGLIPRHHRPPLPNLESFSAVFESISSRDPKATQKRLENDRRTTQNRLLGRGGSVVAGDESGGWAVAEKQVHYSSFYQARKRHININIFVRLVLGRPRACPGDKPGDVPVTNPVANLVQTQVFALFYTVEARQTRVCAWDKPSFCPWDQDTGWKGGTKSLCEKSSCASFARYFYKLFTTRIP